MRTATEQIHIAAPPERVMALLTPERLGEFSPEFRRGRWLDGAQGPAEGAMFKGYNQRGLIRWSTVSRVETYEPGRRIVWRSGHPPEPRNTRWSYELEPSEGGTLVRESYEVLHKSLRSKFAHRFLWGGDAARDENLREGMRTTLNRLKASAEDA
jgi:uncharacterized protein YndB with AHSA1/START domain